VRWEKAINLHLQHPHTHTTTSRDSSFMCTDIWRNDVMKQRHAQISSGNPPVSLELKNIVTSLLFWIKLIKQIVFEHWLVMYLLKCLFWIIFNPKKLRTGALSILNTINFKYTSLKRRGVMNCWCQTSDKSSCVFWNDWQLRSQSLTCSVQSNKQQ